MDPLRRAFWAMTPKWLAECRKVALKPDEQSSFIQSTVNDPLYAKYPPSARFARRFFKDIITKCEELDTEVIEDMYLIHSRLLQEEADTPSDNLHYRTYLMDEASITVKESDSAISQGTTGLQTWPAALHLAEWILENREYFDNRSVLELGCGAGLTGLVLLKTAKPARYIFTDHNDQVLQLLEQNLALNNLPDVSVEILEWGSNYARPVDIVLAADVVFDPTTIPHLVKTIYLLRKRKIVRSSFVGDSK
ncbi:protein-lysine N-methyltransferase EEF2KMT-like isoform X2 [Oscarella lobularis]|uniref:protein-lysine N-methyltransferase EEF2KMT-like isoform X2 n=1 Tax=Oscarella lobularis TaxID=121494 RepID=UPI003313FC06